MALREDELLSKFFPPRRTQKISNRWRFPEEQRKRTGETAVEVKGRWQKGPAVPETDPPTDAVSSCSWLSPDSDPGLQQHLQPNGTAGRRGDAPA